MTTVARIVEDQIREFVALVKAGVLSRRAFIGKIVALGLSVPIAAQILNASGIASELPKSDYKPTKRGGGGRLKGLLWQAPTLLNPHFAVGTKDAIGSRVFYEPLAQWDPDGNLFPILAAEIPSVANGGVAADGRSVIWKLKQGVKWHDGEPFTADDCVFNWEYARHPDTAATTIGDYRGITVEKIESHAIRITFPNPTPFWARAFVGDNMVIPKHLFEGYLGSKSREAPNNLSPVGTGPYKFAEFVPGDIVRGEINSNYYLENRPYFDSIELKGGGDAVSAARAVLQTGEFDYAWNLQVEDEILRKFEENGKGRILVEWGVWIEVIALNFSDPWTEVDGERSSPKTQHPIFSDRAVRDVMNLLVDRGSIAKFIYGRTGAATANWLNAPEKVTSKTTSWEISIEKANQILDSAGWAKGPDGVRTKDGKKLKFLFQTSINAPRQKTQAIVKQACQKAGIELELKSVPASVFFSSDVANPDTYTHFYADMQLWTPQAGGPPDPEQMMDRFTTWELTSKANRWQGRNVYRWRSEDYDRLYRSVQSEFDPVKRASLFIEMNNLLIKERVIIPVVWRAEVAGLNNKIRANLSPWDSPFWQLHDWYREA